MFNTNPGSHSIDTDTEYNFFIPDSTLIAYTGTLDDIEDIRSLPDFAVYPENIYSSDDNYIGDSNPVTVKVYNRGPRGGWTDVEVKIDGNTVHREENKYISGFSGEEITFDFTPTSEKHTVSVTLNNKSVETQERTEENNVVESKDIYFKRYEVPEIVEITPDTIRIADTDEGAFVKVAITKDYTVKKVIFKFDDEVLSEEAYTPGIGEASVYIPKEKLTVGDHKLTAELVYKENATTDNTISEEKQINVKIKESINFAVKTDEESYVNYTVLRKNKYDGRQYYSSSYIVSSVDRKYNAEKKQYECKMYLYEDMQITDDYDVILVYDNGIQLIPLNELNGSTFSMDGAKKVTTEYTDAFSNIYINKPLKINGYELNEWIDGWYSYRDNFLVGDGIDSLEMKVDYNVSGGNDSVTESLDMTKEDGVITLVDNTKTITFTNYAGNIPNREIVAESGDDYYYLDCSFNTSDNNKMMAVLTSKANKQFQDADKVIFYFMDDEAIYEIDLKTLAEDVVDLESIRNNYNKVSYVYDSNNTQILSRTIQRKKENSGAGTGTYELKTDNILAATGEYIIKTKYKSKGIVLEDTQEIVVSGTDVEIVLPEAEEEMTTISVVYPDYYTSVYLEYYDDKDDWHSERVESGDKIVTVPGRRDYRINATTYDGLDLTLKRTVDVTDKTNTEINLGEHFAANVHISNIESDTNIFATDSGSTVSFDLTDFKDEYGSDLYNYSDYYSYDYETKATLKLTDVNDKSKQYEVNYPYGVDYIDYGERVLSFTLPNDIKGDYNYEIVLTRTVPDPPIPLEGIKLDKNELTIEPGSEEVLTVTYIPEDTTDSKMVWWESSDEEIVTVEDGKLKTLQEGTATITVYSDEDYGINDSCEVTVKHMHDMQAVLAKDPTCTEAGNKEYYICNKCEKWYEDKEGTREITDKASVEIAPLGHDYEESITKEAGCEQAGVRTFTCKHDQAHTYTENISATGHNWGEWTIVKAATETETGQRTRICKNDATHTENEEIPKLTHIHTITEVAGIEPTCEEDGIRAHFKCEKCGNLFEDAQATVTIDDPVSVIIKALGHSWGEWKVTKEANCTEKGVETRSCLTDAAHTEEREISATGHSLIKTERKEAGCETAGNIEYYTCSACGHIFSDAEAANEIVLSQTVIEPIGHDWSAWSVSKAATCTNSGEEIRTCAHDGDIQTRAIPPLEHAWGEWQVAKAPTETESGERIRICSHDASHIDKEIIPATGKKPDDTEASDNNEEDRPADYTKTDAAIAKMPEDTSIYTPESVQAAQAAISAVVRGKKISEQAEVDAFTKAIEDALAVLELKDADYGAVEKAKSKIPSEAELTKYTEESVNRVKAAVEAVVGGKKIDEQTIVDGYAKAIEDAIAALVLKSGDATDNPGSHTDDTKDVKQDAPASEPAAASSGKNSSVTNTGSTAAARTGESAAVTTTEDANTVQATSTGDNGSTLVWLIIAGVSAVAALGAALLRQRKKEDK